LTRTDPAARGRLCGVTPIKSKEQIEKSRIVEVIAAVRRFRSFDLSAVGRSMRPLARVLPLLSLAFPLAQAGAKTWHVAPEAVPGIAATDQSQKIGDAVSRARPGDEVVIHGGIYREKIVVDQNGLSDKPIRIRAAQGEYVVATGADRITDWSQVEGDAHVYVTHWPHEFVGWTEHNTHPSDDYHRLIGRCEQVFVNGYALGQVLERDKLSRGAFYVDLDAERLYVWPANNQDITSKKAMVEASVRDRVLHVKGDHIEIKGIRFRYAANRAQQGAAEFSGDHITVTDCTFEYTNASGAEFGGESIVVRNCTFQHNGQLGFGANRAHGLRLTGCTVRNNNIKGFNRGWEAGGNKICLTRGAVIEQSTFVENRGDGIWFDIGNEDCEVHNCLIAFNENAGIFYEISYGLHAHDNVIVGNGFAHTPSAWGASSGISLSSSPSCVIERNLIVGNKEGFNFREQLRTTPRIDGPSESVWNHDQTIRRNVMAYNRDAQVWGWFDVADERHWPASVAASRPQALAMESPHRKNHRQAALDTATHPTGLSLEALKLTFADNLYWPGPGRRLFNWGVTWKRHRKYDTLDAVRRELGLAQTDETREFHVEDYSALDLRVPPDSPAVRTGCYPTGNVPGVRLGSSR
jgi:hypothetical protein